MTTATSLAQYIASNAIVVALDPQSPPSQVVVPPILPARAWRYVWTEVITLGAACRVVQRAQARRPVEKDGWSNPSAAVGFPNTTVARRTRTVAATRGTWGCIPGVGRAVHAF